MARRARIVAAGLAFAVVGACGRAPEPAARTESAERTGEPGERSGEPAERSGEPAERSGEPAERSGDAALDVGLRPLRDVAAARSVAPLGALGEALLALTALEALEGREARADELERAAHDARARWPQAIEEGPELDALRDHAASYGARPALVDAVRGALGPAMFMPAHDHVLVRAMPDASARVATRAPMLASTEDVELVAWPTDGASALLEARTILAALAPDREAAQRDEALDRAARAAASTVMSFTADRLATYELRTRGEGAILVGPVTSNRCRTATTGR